MSQHPALDSSPVPAVAHNSGISTTEQLTADTPRPSTKRTKATFWVAVQSFLWDSDSHLKSPEERRLLFKLDCCVLPCLCLGYFCKYLDQTNLTNAYVSGLQEYLGWYGNQYTYAVALYTAGYAALQVPSTLIVQHVRPSVWLAFCEVTWAVLTFSQAAVKNTRTMYALRFLVAIFESAFFPAGVYLLGSWYTPNELAKRTAIFHFTSAAGTAFSGYMQAAVYTTLSGRYGLQGWQWLYIVCGIITAPCGLMVLFLLPDYPNKGQKRWYLTDAEFQLAQKRMERIKRPAAGKMTRSAFASMLKGWHIWLMPLTYTFYGLGCASGSGGYMNVWLKSTKKYSVAQINLIPTILNVIQSVSIVTWGFLSDYTGSRYLWIAIATIGSVFPCAVLTAWPSSTPFILAAFLLTGFQYVTALYFSWWQEICSNDPLERAVVVWLSLGLQFGMSAWVTIVIFPQTDSPSFRKGFPTTLGFVVVGLLLATVVHLLHRRDIRRGLYDTAEERKYEEQNQGAEVNTEEIPLQDLKHKSEEDPNLPELGR
ncbi:hypothetical protein L202_05171 [Cryptococcus amylolentus CBS 6039]|uniref:Major facilitator superfamily (MFS) profile domain-containing protein n=1 Tax=Cryptococcus amylolentus CBS 6039 TaxID=1295533 RepID=A0A1E3HJI9_9TREE|nr:hypothetical protein L202_05171 [Cryptococcus amylolentus CBS 6039]ODN76504.1 hypothetical protein L202_05171 [Cryptococcus amylolentus CBS 6039]